MGQSIQSEKVLTKNNNTIRCVELDVLRGIAIIAMIIFHFTFDLCYFGFIASDTIYRPNWDPFSKIYSRLFYFNGRG